MLAAIILTLFPVLMFYSALSDVLTMTIANWVSITLVATFCVVAVLSSMSLSDFGWHVSCGVTVLLITFFFFARGWIGGGDAKLASATSLWMGWENVDEYSLLFALFGGVLTLVILVISLRLPARVRGRAGVDAAAEGQVERRALWRRSRVRRHDRLPPDQRLAQRGGFLRAFPLRSKTLQRGDKPEDRSRRRSGGFLRAAPSPIIEPDIFG
jgi:prepilin peptidase CpaA